MSHHATRRGRLEVRTLDPRPCSSDVIADALYTGSERGCVMASIVVRNATVDIPIFDNTSRSLAALADVDGFAAG